MLHLGHIFGSKKNGGVLKNRGSPWFSKQSSNYGWIFIFFFSHLLWYPDFGHLPTHGITQTPPPEEAEPERVGELLETQMLEAERYLPCEENVYIYIHTYLPYVMFHYQKVLFHFVPIEYVH